jgi:hypothetical protein
LALPFAFAAGEKRFLPLDPPFLPLGAVAAAIDAVVETANNGNGSSSHNRPPSLPPPSPSSPASSYFSFRASPQLLTQPHTTAPPVAVAAAAAKKESQLQESPGGKDVAPLKQRLEAANTHTSSSKEESDLDPVCFRIIS